MTEVKTTEGNVLFSFDENETNLAKEIRKYKNLAFADLKDANLKGADLMGANLFSANLFCAKLFNANLQCADLMGADLRCADLRYAKLEEANFYNANLKYADLRGADLYDADLRYADLRRAKNVPYVPIACPSEGSFIAWKKVGYKCLVKLEIPEDARRCSATSNKCRCDKAFVLDIEDLEADKHLDKVVNDNYCGCVYEVGKMVYPDSFDDDRWNECSNGIHFFMDKQDAIEY